MNKNCQIKSHLLVWDVYHLLSIPVALHIGNSEQFYKAAVFVEESTECCKAKQSNNVPFLAPEGALYVILPGYHPNPNAIHPTYSPTVLHPSQMCY